MRLYLKNMLYIVVILLVFSSMVFAEDLKYKRTVERYSSPAVTLINQNGKRVRFNELFRTQKPVIIDFIFGTCTTICPVLSAGYVNLQNRLARQAEKVHLVSISIDPENDSPNVMKEYLNRYQAKPGWDFYTGSRADINTVMKALDAYIPNKMSHYPLTLIYNPKEGNWVRILGLMSSSELLRECKKIGVL